MIWTALVMGVGIGLPIGGVLTYLLLERREISDAIERASAPRRPRPPAVSIHEVPIPYPRPICARCGFKITMRREGDRCLLEASPSALRYYHAGNQDCGRESGA